MYRAVIKLDGEEIILGPETCLQKMNASMQAYLGSTGHLFTPDEAYVEEAIAWSKIDP